jgi:hypothetical protein
MFGFFQIGDFLYGECGDLDKDKLGNREISSFELEGFGILVTEYEFDRTTVV